MENFELIDRFFEKDLTEDELREFERRLNEEDAFQEDLRFYESMNSGVYSLEREKLKKKLDQLYDEYASTGQRKKNYSLVWISGIAASLLIAGYFFIFHLDNPGNEIAKKPDPQQEEGDRRDNHPEEQPTSEDTDEKVDSDEPSRLPDGVLAFGGIATLPPRHVLAFSYPAPLFYTFDGNTLRLRGDPLLPALALDLVKTKDNSYQLNYLDKAYKLRETKTFSPLSELTTKITGSSSSETITVAFETAVSTATRDDRLNVKISRQRGKPGFVFDGSDELTLSGNFTLNNTKVFSVEFHGDRYLLVQRDNDLFVLEGKPSTLMNMVKASMVNSKLPALFEDRDPLKLNVQIP